mgnify:CR=1 FL=1
MTCDNPFAIDPALLWQTGLSDIIGRPVPPVLHDLMLGHSPLVVTRLEKHMDRMRVEASVEVTLPVDLIRRALDRAPTKTKAAKEAGMKAAIAHLEQYLETLETNEPINRAEGNEEQADLEAKNATEVRAALAVLRSVLD